MKNNKRFKKINSIDNQKETTLRIFEDDKLKFNTEVKTMFKIKNPEFIGMKLSNSFVFKKIISEYLGER